jgi:hypothetical protein
MPRAPPVSSAIMTIGIALFVKLAQALFKRHKGVVSLPAPRLAAARPGRRALRCLRLSAEDLRRRRVSLSSPQAREMIRHRKTQACFMMLEPS